MRREKKGGGRRRRRSGCAYPEEKKEEGLCGKHLLNVERGGSHFAAQAIFAPQPKKQGGRERSPLSDERLCRPALKREGREGYHPYVQHVPWGGGKEACAGILSLPQPQSKRGECKVLFKRGKKEGRSLGCWRKKKKGELRHVTPREKERKAPRRARIFGPRRECSLAANIGKKREERFRGRGGGKLTRRKRWTFCNYEKKRPAPQTRGDLLLQTGGGEGRDFFALKRSSGESLLLYRSMKVLPVEMKKTGRLSGGLAPPRPSLGKGKGPTRQLSKTEKEKRTDLQDLHRGGKEKKQQDHFHTKGSRRSPSLYKRGGLLGGGRIDGPLPGRDRK